MPNKKDENKDLTRIEDLSEFLHQKDSALDGQFDAFSPDSETKKEASLTGIDLDALEETDEIPPEVPMDFPTLESNDLDEAGAFETSSLEDFSFEDHSFSAGVAEADSYSDNPMESSSDAFALTSDDDLSNDNLGDSFSTPMEIEDEAEVEVEVDLEPEDYLEPRVEESYTNTSERFEDVKTFANNFSYGQVQGGGNPPYSIIVRHIKFSEEADDIVNLLKEFGIVTEATEKDTLMAIELGSLIIPQISEYTAIILAHKLRRFDLDLEVGLSDEVHPSKSGESNPRGLLKKESLKQNRSESLKLTEIDNSIKDIIVTTMSSIQGFNIESYIGVQTTFSIVEEAELERLQYVQRSHRENSELYEFENTETSELTSEKAFKDYQNSFALIYEDLSMQLKQKAFAQNANALLGLTFQLSPLNFERAHLRVSAYQITCSATLAIISRENS